MLGSMETATIIDIMNKLLCCSSNPEGVSESIRKYANILEVTESPIDLFIIWGVVEQIIKDVNFDKKTKEKIVEIWRGSYEKRKRCEKTRDIMRKYLQLVKQAKHKKRRRRDTKRKITKQHKMGCTDVLGTPEKKKREATSLHKKTSTDKPKSQRILEMDLPSNSNCDSNYSSNNSFNYSSNFNQDFQFKTELLSKLKNEMAVPMKKVTVFSDQSACIDIQNDGPLNIYIKEERSGDIKLFATFLLNTMENMVLITKDGRRYLLKNEKFRLKDFKIYGEHGSEICI